MASVPIVNFLKLVCKEYRHVHFWPFFGVQLVSSLIEHG